jgi:hypothetical protein
MLIANKFKQLNFCLHEIEKLHVLQKKYDPRTLKLGLEALNIINHLISETPFDFNLRRIRIKLNSEWLFNNYNLVNEDALFIVNHPGYSEEKIYGYKWLLKINTRNGSNKDAVNILENKLIDVYLIYKGQFKKNKILSETYYDLAKAYLKVQNEPYAYNLLELSYSYNPYVDDRNLYLGLYMLRTKQYEKAETYLWAHFLWSNHISKSKIMKYGVLLNTLYENNKLDNYPNLIALLFHIIRSNKSSFGCFVVTDFYEKFGEGLKANVAKFPTNSKLNAVLANTYYLDYNNYKKAYTYYVHMLKGDDPFYQCHMSRVYIAFQSKKKDLIKFLQKNQPKFKEKDLFSYYEIAKNLYGIYCNSKNEAYLKIAEHYVKHSYDVMNAYIKYGIGDSHCNSVNYYDLICNLYGKILTTYANNFIDIEQKNVLLICAASTHWDGFKNSYDLENLELALSATVRANNTDLFIFYLGQLVNLDVKLDLTADFFKTIYRVNYRLSETQNTKKMLTIYRHSKNILDKNAIKDGDSVELFVNQAYDFFKIAVNNSQYLNFIFNEIKDLISRDNIANVHIDIYGVFLYYLGLCYDINNDIEQAKKWYGEAIKILKNINDDDFYEFYTKALTAYKAL